MTFTAFGKHPLLQLWIKIPPYSSYTNACNKVKGISLYEAYNICTFNTLSSNTNTDCCIYSHEIWSVAMDDGTESHPVTKRRGHVSNLHVSVALSHVLAPLLQALHARLPCHYCTGCNSSSGLFSNPFACSASGRVTYPVPGYTLIHACA